MKVDTRNFVLSTALILAAILAPQARGDEIPDLVIRNVHIIGTGSQTEHTLANVRIEGNKIKLVSKDTIPAEDGIRVLDADNGYLVGKLSVGSAPIFMILSDDPTADLNVMLDTRQFVVFAVDDGRLVVNKLQQVLGEPNYPSTRLGRSRWLAYEPPPFAIPTSVEASRKWNAFRTKYVNGLFFSAIALDRQWISQGAESRTFKPPSNYFKQIWRTEMPHFAAGVIRFQNEVYPQKKELFEKLSKGQAPEALFITCSDSRIETAMITQTDPGELFICRNAGNIVPPHTNHTGGMTASIEFAVSALNVPHIVICGHTECGAMKGALNPEGLDSLPHVKEWLGYSKAAVAAVDGLSPEDEEQRMQMLLERNVMLQLQHLKTHPSVAARLAKGDLKLHGWVYDIKTGDVVAYNEANGRFEAVDVHYSKEMAEIAKSSSCTA